MRYTFITLILSYIFSTFLSTVAIADEPKVTISRGQDELHEFYVNVGGTNTKSASFGDPASCATSGALICGGTYTPVTSNTTNITTTTPFETTFLRVNNVVHVQIRINVDHISANTITAMDVSLPIASDFANSSEASGVGASSNDDVATDGYDLVSITGSSANDTAVFTWRHGDDVGGGQPYAITATFTYVIK